MLLGFAIRIYKITESPGGLYIDETSIGYNAYSLTQTGKDEHGVQWPLFFEAFGEWKLPVYIYSVYLTQVVIGPTDLSVRLPAVIYGSLSVLFIGLLVSEMFIKDKRKEWLGIFSVLLLAISPWHFQFTHAGFEASAAVFFLVLGLWLFFKAKNLHSGKWLILSIISLVFTLYSYNSSRIVVPVIGFILFIFYFREFNWKAWVAGILFGLIICIPFLKFALSPSGMVRAQMVSIFYQPYIYDPWKIFLSNYWINISPKTLFISGDPTIAHLTPFRMSLVYPFQAIFLLVGLFWCFWKITKEKILLLVLLLISFIPPALATLNPHALRGIFAVLPIQIISAVGLMNLIWLFKNRIIKYLLLVIILSVFSYSLFKFLDIYHNYYAPNAYTDWQVDKKIISNYILANGQKYNAIYLSDDYGAIAYWWYLKLDPQMVLRDKSNLHIGKYYFAADINKTLWQPNSIYINQQMTDKKLITTIYYPNDQIAAYIWGN